jgi:gliding motility-associated-like protein
MGVYTYVPFSVPDYKEYIGTDFPALNIGQTYTMTITVSLADSSTYATDGLGVYFTTHAISLPSQYTTISASPQIDYSSYGPIHDKANWVTLSKTFVADSAYTHLTLGCFKPNNVLQKDSVGNGSKRWKYGYYYIGQIGMPDSTRHAPTDSITPIDTSAHVVDTSTYVPPDTAHYFFPSAFTPNDDGLNDVFRLITNPGVVYEAYTLNIYNRWGERIFMTHDAHAGWNGRYNGVPQDMGVYYYFARFIVNGKVELIKGDVTLVR